MKKLILAIGVSLVMLSVVGVTVAFAIQRQTTGAEETTQDIGAVWDQDVIVAPTSFKPSLSAAAAIGIAAENVKTRVHWDVVALGLPARATIAKFTGEPEGPRTFVKDLPVRIVVFDNVPTRASLGETIKTRVSVVLDDATGEFIYGVISGETRDNCATSPNNVGCP